jgi:PKD repeat protein
MEARLPSVRLMVTLAVIATALIALAPSQAHGQDSDTVEVCTGPIVSQVRNHVFSADLAVDPPLPPGEYEVVLTVKNAGQSFSSFETAVADVAGTQVGPTARPANQTDFPQTATATVTIDEPLTSVTVSDSLPNVRHVASFEACVTFTPLTCDTVGVFSNPETTDVVAGTVPGATYPTNAVVAWQPFDSDPSFWDDNIDHTFSQAAWVWQSYRVVDPMEGAIVDFEETFEVPGDPTKGTMYVTADNGYQLSLNSVVLATEIASEGDLDGDGIPEVPAGAGDWETVEQLDLSDQLVAGTNVLSITGVNYQRRDTGTINNNPAGVIYEAEIEYCATP